MNSKRLLVSSESQGNAPAQAQAPASKSRWQLLVVPSATTATSKLNSVRIDAAHPINAPHLPLGWSQQVGWHNPISTTALPTINTSTVGSAHSKIKAPKFLLNADRNAVRAEQVLDQGELDKRLIEMASQLATDIRDPLAAAHRIVSVISHQVRTNSFLTMDDADLLATASNKLDLVAQWTDSILLTRKLEEGGIEIIRSRFTPAQWRDSVEELLEQIVLPKRIKIQWIGWDAELPCLYLDPNHLTRAIFNLVASSAAASEIQSELTIRINWQNNVTQRLMITIEDNGPGLPSNLMKILNSSTVDSLLPAKGIGLQTARQLITAIGGLVAAQHGSTSGTIIRLSLPVDTYASMIRAWILQNATIGADRSKYHVNLFAVRSGIAEADAFNVHLQKSASSKQFVYRVAANRWLVLEMKSAIERSDSTLMANAQRYVPVKLQDSQPWLSQSVFQSQSFELDGLLGRSDGSLRLPQLTEQLAAKFSELLNHQKPAIESLTINKDEIPTPHIRREIKTLEISPSSHAIQNSNSAQSSGSSEQPGAKTVSDIVKQWKMVQAKLAKITNHPAVIAHATAPASSTTAVRA